MCSRRKIVHSLQMSIWSECPFSGPGQEIFLSFPCLVRKFPYPFLAWLGNSLFHSKPVKKNSLSFPAPARKFPYPFQLGQEIFLSLLGQEVPLSFTSLIRKFPYPFRFGTKNNRTLQMRCFIGSAADF